LFLGVFVDPTGVQAAGGLLIQILPKAASDPALVELLESRLSTLQGFTPLLQAGKTLPSIFEELLGDLGLEMFPSQIVRFHCGCSFDRVLGALKLLGEAELRDMIETDKGAEATCHFCGEVYKANIDQLEQLIDELKEAK
ncbi:Hsp33 family molecular chaperone HslO, partial [Pseudanabaenaceae cyanobacterium LEGE 13415]|nr:Hsp33 family molecular chaperone HslO [Pseudanabaenaceae cyanobacterium LEGE 13415]